MPEGINIEETAIAAAQIENAALQLRDELDAEYPDNPGTIRYLLTSIGRAVGTVAGRAAPIFWSLQ